MRRFVSALGLFALAASTPPALADIYGPPPSGAVILGDSGGSIAAYLVAMAEARDIRIAGDCASACTMLLRSRNVCVYPQAALLFHKGTTALGTRTMFESYPRRIAAWVARHRALDSFQFTSMSGQEAIGLGVRPCEPRFFARRPARA